MFKQIRNIWETIWTSRFKKTTLPNLKYYFGTKRSVMKFLSDAIGDDWKSIARIELTAGTIKIERVHKYGR